MTWHGPIPVLHFSNEKIRGGAEEHMLLLLKMLDRGRFRLHLVCPVELAERLRPDLPEDVEVIPLALHTPADLRSAAQLARIVRRRRIGILHSHMFHASLVASPIGWLCRVPVIVETPHVREAWRRGWIRSHYFVDRLVGRFVDHYIAVSEANARYLIEQKRLSARKITVIANGSDLRRFDPNRHAPAGMKEALDFGATDPIVVVAARLEPQKGHQVLLDALPAITTRFPSTHVVFVGDGVLREDLERRVAADGLGKSVRFVGYQSNIPDWLALADFTVLPSFYEGLPLAAIESLAAGRPVVATAVDGTPEVVINEKNGLTVPPGDPARLAEAVCRLLGDPGLRLSMGVSGRQWVLDHFSLDRQIHRTEEFYLAAWHENYTATRHHNEIGTSETAT